jgi:hypothetical protein
MQTIKLKVNDKIYKQLMLFLGRFKKDEIQVINENNEFLSVQDYLKNELSMIEDENTKFINIDQLDNELETTIRKYEA